MEFRNRQTTTPGRVKLKNVSTNAETIYDISMADNPTEAGTPLNKQTFDTFREDLLDEVQSKLEATFVLSGTTLIIYL